MTNICYFFRIWANWWNSISKIHITKTNNLEECILFGFSGNDNLTQVLNYCMIYTKYYIYVQRLFDNNHLELYAYLTLLKYNLNIGHQIYKNSNRADKFERFLFLHDNLWYSILKQCWYNDKLFLFFSSWIFLIYDIVY